MEPESTVEEPPETLPGDGQRPRIRVTVNQVDQVPLGDFSPLATPRELGVSFGDASVGLLERLRAGIALALSPGNYDLSIFDGETLPAQVLPDCACHLMLAAGTPDEDEDDLRMLTAVELAFDKPLILGNILAILARLQSRFQDHEVTDLLNRLTTTIADQTGITDLKSLGLQVAGRLASFVGDWLPPGLARELHPAKWKGTAENLLHDAATVRLERISGHPVKRGDRWVLELRFTGEWDFMGQVKVPFRHVRVHRAILPAPHALLERLFSAQPLATAQTRGKTFPALDLAQQLGGMVESLRGRLTVRGEFPDLTVLAGMADEGQWKIDTRLLGMVDVETGFHGDVSPDRIALQIEHLDIAWGDRRIRAAGGFEGWTGLADEVSHGDTAIGRCLESLISGEWSSEKLSFLVHATVLPDSSLADSDVRWRYSHPLLVGESDVRLQLRNVTVDGKVSARFGQAFGGSEEKQLGLHFAADTAVNEGSFVDVGRTRFEPSMPFAHFTGSLDSTATGAYEVRLAGSSDFQLRTETGIDAFPELNLDDCIATTRARAEIALDGVVRLTPRRSSPFEADFKGTTGRMVVHEAEATMDGRLLRLPPGSRFVSTIHDGLIAGSGLGRASIRVAWDLLGTSPVLRHQDRYVMLFVLPLCQGELDVHISPAGGISVSGREGGLYDARFFNALINPADELDRWLEILDSDEAVDRVLASIEVFSPEAVTWLRRIRSFVRRGQRIAEEEGIEQPADGLPAHRLARLAARMVFGDVKAEKRLLPLIMGVIEGNGPDVAEIKRVIADYFPEHDYEFEVDRGLRLASRILSPAAPMPPRQIRQGTALAETPHYLERYASLPDANTLYATVDSSAPLPRGFSAAVATMAPYLSITQLAYVLGKKRTDWDQSALARLQHVQELKQRVRDISQGYGGVAYAPQAMAIAFFLADTIRRSRQLGKTRSGARDFAQENERLRSHCDIPDVLLGPGDVAALLHAGLASAWSGRAVQLNQRLLLEMVFEQPASYLRDVLVELGINDARVLTTGLNALLDLPQQAMREPLDLAARFSERMGFEFPRLGDFLAGGRRANHSYFEALAKTADQVLTMAEPYRALKFYLQEARRPLPRPERKTAGRRQLWEQLEAAIAKADRAGKRCDFGNLDEGPRKRAEAAYRRAFECGKKLLKAQPRAFHEPLFKEFWARNHEALTILSVVRNAQEDVDQVRHWLRTRGHRRSVPRDEQSLIDLVIDSLYYFPADRERVRLDPLVRLLLDPPEGHYNFTIVSAMGVITGGAKGTELEEAYGRLEERRGVRVVRADTASGRSLEYNAQRIIEAVRTAATPWGYIGYSQGCANGLMAENLLMGGTPEQRRLLDGLVCRNLLFSAFNASAHGTCGDEKFLDAMVYLDNFIAHYQARFSSRAIQTALRSVRLALDSQPAMLSMLGSRSLSQWGVLGLHLGGQFKATAPTSTMRGIVEPDNLPEALEWLANVLSKQVEHDHHDTQVTIDDALGHSILARTPQLELLEGCDMGALVQRIHHWSPLKKDTEFVTTDRDRKQAIYESPKDRHVFPWVDVNARFGLISRK
jgi:hypothetical protein